MSYLRIGLYIVLFIVSAFFVESKKEQVRRERALEVESVLSIMSDQGLPLKIYEVQRRPFSKHVLLNIRKCSNHACFYITHADRSLYSVGQRVFDPKTHQQVGQVLQVGQQSAPATGLYEVRVQLKSDYTNPSINVEVQSLSHVIVVPIEALTQIKEEVYVYVFENEKPVRRDVTIGMLGQNEVYLSGGLKSGEQVIVEGISLLEIFDKYRVVGKYEFPTEKSL